jgi:hypothetical protein
VVQLGEYRELPEGVLMVVVLFLVRLMVGVLFLVRLMVGVLFLVRLMVVLMAVLMVAQSDRLEEF